MKRALFLVVTAGILILGGGAEPSRSESEICRDVPGFQVCFQYVGRARLFDVLPLEVIRQGLLPLKTAPEKKPETDPSVSNEDAPEASPSPPDTTQLKDVPLDVYRLKITNRLPRKVRISPAHFYLLTLNDEIVRLHQAVQDAIQWPRKMKGATLSRGDTMQGDVFFPVARNAVRKLVYGDLPGFEISLF